MADGKTHDRLIWLSTPIAGLLAWQAQPELAAIVAAGHLWGGLYLSPDLDVPSNPWRRWGPLRCIWLPYQMASKHRGLSHWIALGTLTRLLYLLCIISPLLIVLGLQEPAIAVAQRYSAELIAFAIGVEISAWVHLAADGLLLPLPRK